MINLVKKDKKFLYEKITKTKIISTIEIEQEEKEPEKEKEEENNVGIKKD